MSPLGYFRRLHELHRHLLDQHDLLRGHVFLLEQPFELSHGFDRFSVLQRVNDDENVMVNHRFFSALREP